MPIVQGTAYWAKLDPNSPAQKYQTTSKEDTEWCLDLGLSSKAVKMIQGMNPSASVKDGKKKNHASGGPFFKFKKNAYTREGKPLPAPRVVDAQKNDISGTAIGNGSMVNVLFRSKEMEQGQWTGKSVFYLDAVQVLELVPYDGPKNEDFSEVDGGYQGEENFSRETTEDKGL